MFFFVIPFQSDAGVYFSGPVCCQIVSFQQSVSEMLSVLLAHVLDCKIVHDKCERYRSSVMQPESRGVACGLISKRCQTIL
jgi:hypothetical protein